MNRLKLYLNEDDEEPLMPEGDYWVVETDSAYWIVSRDTASPRLESNNRSVTM